jgi:hypothetical protein
MNYNADSSAQECQTSVRMTLTPCSSQTALYRKNSKYKNRSFWSGEPGEVIDLLFQRLGTGYDAL